MILPTRAAGRRAGEDAGHRAETLRDAGRSATGQARRSAQHTDEVLAGLGFAGRAISRACAASGAVQ